MGCGIAQLNLGPPSDNFVARVREKRGLDMSGIERSIDTNFTTTNFDTHGPGNEPNPGQLPVSAEAMAHYVEVVAGFDRVNSRVRSDNSVTLTFEKM